MAHEVNLATQQRLGDAVNAGELEELRTIFADDVIDHDPAPDQAPGPQGYIDFFTGLRASFPDAHLDVDQVVADEDRVAIAYRLSGTHTGEFDGVAGTGRRVEVRGMQIARFVDGKIVERWGSTDELGLLAQIDAS